MKSDKYEYVLPDDTDEFIVECCTLEFPENVIKELDEISNGINTDRCIVLNLFPEYEHVGFQIGETIKVIYKNVVFEGTVEESVITDSLEVQKVLCLTYLEHINN